MQIFGAPSRYSGSVWTNDMVICGHNYSLHFGPLLSAEVGDTIIFTEVEGNVFNYVIRETEILQPTATEKMTIPDGWDLAVFICSVSFCPAILKKKHRKRPPDLVY